MRVAADKSGSNTSDDKIQMNVEPDANENIDMAITHEGGHFPKPHGGLGSGSEFLLECPNNEEKLEASIEDVMAISDIVSDIVDNITANSEPNSLESMEASSTDISRHNSDSNVSLSADEGISSVDDDEIDENTRHFHWRM